MPKMKLWMRMATVVTVVWLIGWYFIYGQNIRYEINNAQVEQQREAENYKAAQQECADWHNGKSRKSSSTLKPEDEKWLNDKFGEWACERAARGPPETNSDLSIARDYLWSLVASLIGIWGFFAMLQWLIRGALP
jgi:hypothetical protein